MGSLAAKGLMDFLHHLSNVYFDLYYYNQNKTYTLPNSYKLGLKNSHFAF